MLHGMISHHLQQKLKTLAAKLSYSPCLSYFRIKPQKRNSKDIQIFFLSSLKQSLKQIETSVIHEINSLFKNPIANSTTALNNIDSEILNYMLHTNKLSLQELIVEYIKLVITIKSLVYPTFLKTLLTELCYVLETSQEKESKVFLMNIKHIISKNSSTVLKQLEELWILLSLLETLSIKNTVLFYLCNIEPETDEQI